MKETTLKPSHPILNCLLIKNHIYILENLRPCNDLILTFQPNLVLISEVYSFLHSNCHYQTVENLIYKCTEAATGGVL